MWAEVPVLPLLISFLFSLGIYACLPLGKMLVRPAGPSSSQDGRATCDVSLHLQLALCSREEMLLLRSYCCGV